MVKKQCQKKPSAPLIPEDRTPLKLRAGLAFVELALKFRFAFAIVGLALGLVCIVGGIILTLSGAVGHTTWTTSILGFSSKLNDAAPGVLLFVVGIAVIFLTRMRKIEFKSGTNKQGEFFNVVLHHRAPWK
jgi:hypothetical protein